MMKASCGFLTKTAKNKEPTERKKALPACVWRPAEKSQVIIKTSLINKEQNYEKNPITGQIPAGTAAVRRGSNSQGTNPYPLRYGDHRRTAACRCLGISGRPQHHRGDQFSRLLAVNHRRRSPGAALPPS